MPKVSIIVPNYNHAPYLQQRLDSIFSQTHQNFEVVILDDHSTDHSLEILEPYKNHPKVSSFNVNQTNSGSPFKQWQKGLKLAKGDYIWIAESDDFCDFNFLETQLKCMETSEVAVAKTVAVVDGTSKSEVKHPLFDPSKKDDALLYCPILNVSSVLFKSSLVKCLGDEQYATYNIMGDRVFYFEHFREAKVVFNRNTNNYFRKSKSSISKINNRGFDYYKTYFDEHCKFISYAKRKDSAISNTTTQRYIKKFYKRVSNRMPREQKQSLAYLGLFVKYRIKLLIN